MVIKLIHYLRGREEKERGRGERGARGSETERERGREGEKGERERERERERVREKRDGREEMRKKSRERRDRREEMRECERERSVLSIDYYVSISTNIVIDSGMGVRQLCMCYVTNRAYPSISSSRTSYKRLGRSSPHSEGKHS